MIDLRRACADDYASDAVPDGHAEVRRRDRLELAGRVGVQEVPDPLNPAPFQESI